MENMSISELSCISEVRKKLNEYKLMLCYRGMMTQEMVIALLNLAENKLNNSASSSTVKSRVFSVMVECLQNITQHSKKTGMARSNMLMVGLAGAGYIIYSGSIVRNKEVNELKNKIQEINTMSEEDLKKQYKYLIMNESSSEQPNIDLGLIQIARKTGNALVCDFEQIDSEHYYFSLNTLVDH